MNIRTLLTPGVKLGLLQQTSLDIFYCLRHYGNFPSGAIPKGKYKILDFSYKIFFYAIHHMGSLILFLNILFCCLFNEAFAHFSEIRFAVIARGGSGLVGLYRPNPSGQIVFSHGNGSTPV